MILEGVGTICGGCPGLQMMVVGIPLFVLTLVVTAAG